MFGKGDKLGDVRWIFGVGDKSFGFNDIRFDVGGNDWYVIGSVFVRRELDFGLDVLCFIFCLGVIIVVIWVVNVGFGNFKIFCLVNIGVLVFEWIFCF